MGRRFENYVKSKRENSGYYVIRSAGSRGIFDLIAIKDGIAFGIQCKKNGLSKKEIEKVISTAKVYGIVPCIAYKEGNRVVIKSLDAKFNDIS